MRKNVCIVGRAVGKEGGKSLSHSDKTGCSWLPPNRRRSPSNRGQLPPRTTTGARSIIPVPKGKKIWILTARLVAFVCLHVVMVHHDHCCTPSWRQAAGVSPACGCVLFTLLPAFSTQHRAHINVQRRRGGGGWRHSAQWATGANGPTEKFGGPPSWRDRLGL